MNTIGKQNQNPDFLGNLEIPGHVQKKDWLFFFFL